VRDSPRPPQSVALFGHQGIARDDPDFFPAFVLNQILGGSAIPSRLMQEVRVERGLTYGVYSYLGLARIRADHGMGGFPPPTTWWPRRSR
jgi:predicted Zn-dependent peptidase